MIERIEGPAHPEVFLDIDQRRAKPVCRRKKKVRSIRDAGRNDRLETARAHP